MAEFEKALILIFCGGLIVGCEKQHSVELTASATAEASDGGSIAVRCSTPQEIARLQIDIARRNALDRNTATGARAIMRCAAAAA